jgi:exodeoxyribonuclease VII large subunit
VFAEVHGRFRDARLASNTAAHQLQLLLTRRLHQAHLSTDALTSKISYTQLQTRLRSAQDRFAAATVAQRLAVENKLSDAQQRLGLATASLDALSPLAVLSRGYAIALDEQGRLIRDSQAVSIGDEVKVRLAKGKLKTRVEDTEES